MIKGGYYNEREMYQDVGFLQRHESNNVGGLFTQTMIKMGGITKNEIKSRGEN